MAIDTALQIITVRAPQYASDPRISDLISLSTLQTGDCFGTKKQLAIALRVMHWLAMEARNGGDGGSSTSGSGAAGMIKSEKEGDLARSYGSGGFSDTKSDLVSTAYGQELLSLMRQCFFKPRTRLMGLCSDG